MAKKMTRGMRMVVKSIAADDDATDCGSVHSAMDAMRDAWRKNPSPAMRRAIQKAIHDSPWCRRNDSRVQKISQELKGKAKLAGLGRKPSRKPRRK